MAFRIILVLMVLILTGCAKTFSVRVQAAEHTTIYKNQKCQTPCYLTIKSDNCDSSRTITTINNQNEFIRRIIIVGCSDTVIYLR